MTKRKVRRVKRTRSDTDSPRPVSTSANPSPTLSTRRREPDEEELRDTYAYVLQDLRRMALVAAAMFLLLISLGFLL